VERRLDQRFKRPSKAGPYACHPFLLWIPSPLAGEGAPEGRERGLNAEAPGEEVPSLRAWL